MNSTTSPATHVSLSLQFEALSVEPDEQKSEFLALPGEIKNHIYSYAFPANALIQLRAGGLERTRPRSQRATCGWRVGPTTYFSPAQPALTKTCKQLQKETFEYYYISNTFFFADTMFQPGVLSALRRNQSGMAMIRKIRVYRSIRHVLHPRWMEWETLTMRFSAALDQQNNIKITDIRGTGGKNSLIWQPGMSEGLCACFVEQIALNMSANTSNNDGLLLNFLERYIAETDKDINAKEEVCKNCGRLKGTVVLEGSYTYDL